MHQDTALLMSALRGKTLENPLRLADRKISPCATGGSPSARGLGGDSPETTLFGMMTTLGILGQSGAPIEIASMGQDWPLISSTSSRSSAFA